MVGIGSGERDRDEAKATTEDAHAFDIRLLKKNGMLAPGNSFDCTWILGDWITLRIGVEVEQHLLVIKDIVTSIAGRPSSRRVVDQAVPFAATPCAYGGFRRWFRCQKCRRRVAVIYFRGDSLACRHCHELVYPSQRQRGGDRARDRAQKIRMRLGGSANLLLPFPEKPKWMRWRNYERLRVLELENHSYNLECLAAWITRRRRSQEKRA